MKTMRFAGMLLGMLMGGTNLVYAQKPAANSSAAVATPDLSNLNIGKVLAQMQTATVDGEAPPPVQVVVQFLQLRPDQVQVFGQLLQARQTAVTPLLAAIQQRVQQLEALLSSGGNPGDIGVLVIQIHALQQQVAQVQQNFLAHFASLLDQEQRQRLAAVHIAAQLQPVLPAFQELYLF
ncbi:MAG TPA: hypothetical protein VOA78_12050 [Candidatus Dormibacteraeota bacterium]|nr:hypothetical protein [Candidatus Dormibacteraeota bacterium]